MRNGRPRKAEQALIDWVVIRNRVAAGESPSAVANSFPVSRQAIEKRMRREKWRVPEIKQEDDGGIRWLDLVKQCPIAGEKAKHFGRFPPSFRADIAAAILKSIAGGNPQSRSCDLHGSSLNEFRSWRAADPQLDSLARAAVAACSETLIGRVDEASKTDWKAGAFLLTHLPDHRAEFAEEGQASGRGGGIQVTINVSRDEKVAIEGGVRDVIDVTPEKP